MVSVSLVYSTTTLAASARTKKPGQKTAPQQIPAATPAAPTLAPADSSPAADLKKANASLKKVLQKQRPSWSPEAEAKNVELKKIVDSFLDFEELSRRALARHWDPLAPKQRTDFVSTLRELITRSYVKQVYGQPEYDLKFDKEVKADQEATVTATLTTVSNGKKVTLGIDYRMIYRSGHWVVYDVITDEQSLLENYRAEFNKIITRESFDALLKRMKKKVEEKAEKADDK